MIAHLLTLALVSSEARAADHFRVQPSFHDGQPGLVVQDPGIGGQGAFSGGAYFASAQDIYQDGGYLPRATSMHLAAGYSLFNRLRLELDLPYYVDVIQNEAVSFSGVGDLRISATIPLVMQHEKGFGFALAPWGAAPTSQSLVTETVGQSGGGLMLTLGGRADDVSFRLNGGAATVDGHGRLDGGIGLEADVADMVGLGAEVFTFAPVGAAAGGATAPLEAMAYFSFGRQTRAFVGGGGTVIPGEGGPAWRVTAGVSTRRGAGPGDMDGDGVPDATDLCPSVDEDMDGFKDTDGCLDPDNDDDGVPDTVDRCVDKAEDIDGFTDGDGCPDLDNDHDGLLDTEDMCPDQPGSRETEGCPDSDGDGVGDATDECPDRRGSIDAFGCSDRDGDHVPDHRDRCPDEKADPRIDPRRSDGCPGRAFVTTSRIEILDRVLFDTGSSVIKAESYAILEEVARIMRADPGLRLVEVAGHTDDVGSHEYNQRLSELRAAAVRRFLTERGIDPRRLDSEGYGETRPVAPNDSEDGRARNRRVEFVIKEVGKR